MSLNQVHNVCDGAFTLEFCWELQVSMGNKAVGENILDANKKIGLFPGDFWPGNDW